jgi:hypothetical protein
MVPIWKVFEELSTRNKRMETGQSKTPYIFGRSVTYVAPPFRNCSTIPIGVLSGYATKRQEVRDTWAKDSSCVYFIVGKKDGAWPEEEATLHSDLLLLDMEEVYQNTLSILPYKTALWFYLANQRFPEAMHILKTDDDSYVDVDGVQAELLQGQPDYWGDVRRKGKPIRDPDSKWYIPSSIWSNEAYPDFCSGAGYVLSRKALRCLVSTIRTQPYMPLEDVSTGIAMQACGIEGTHTALIDVFGQYGPSEPWLIKHYFKSPSQNITIAAPFDAEA